MTPERIRQIFKAVETGDSAAFFAHIADDVDWTVMGTHPKRQCQLSRNWRVCWIRTEACWAIPQTG
jgi:hypothetical protein